jgi:ubiquitin carboxyl-terminal hydrolase 4/11/15
MKENSDDSTKEINEKNEEEEQYKNEINIENNQSKQKDIIKHERISLEELFNKKMNLSDELNKGRTGLVNIGNTCFMNSALQCLSNCYELTKYFLLDYYENDINMDNKLGSGGKISLVYANLLENLWKSDEKYLNPSSFKSIFALFVRKFSGFAQQDSNEFLIYLLDKIHEDLNSVTKKPYIEIEEKGKDETDEDAAKRWWEKHLLRENSIIVDLFHGQFKSTITCNYCNRVAVNFDSYMSLSLPIPSGKFEIIIKYFGYEISNYNEFKIPITENTTVLNIIDFIKNELKKKNCNKNKAISNPPRKNKRKKKNQNKNKKEYNEEVSLKGDIIEMVLLTKNKNIYKVFINNDYIFSYLQEGYELVAYEKKINRENIYFYLTQYSYNYYNFILSFFYNTKTYLFDYPFVIDIEPKQKIYNIYEKICDFLKIFDLNKNNKVETLNINFPFETINKEKEKEIGYSIYLNQYTEKKNNSICESIFSSKYINYLLLEKHSSSQSINNLKKELNLRENERLTLDINILFKLDKLQLPKYSINSEKKTYYSGNDINLYDCLNLFNSEEILEGDNEWYCNICKTHRDVNKKMDIFKAPYYLIIQLKRFKQDHEMGQRFIFNLFSSNKNTSLVSFPINELDLSKYILSNDNSEKKYKLIGVINHYGGSSFGHYTAYCLNDNQWFEYNDESVSPIDENNLISSAAYVLFYKRINN